MNNNYKLKIIYKGLDKNVVVTTLKIFKFNNYESFRKSIINALNDEDKKDDWENFTINNKEKFVLDLETKFTGLDKVFNENTFEFLKKKALESKTESLKAYITKVKEYPEFKPPQIYKTLETSLKKAIDGVIGTLNKELTEEDLENGKRIYIKQNKEEREFTEELCKYVHSNVFCNNCTAGNFFGLRYICAECNNFNLCENCYKNDIHSHNKEHTFIRLKDPIDVDITNYSCIFNPSKIFECREYDSFELEVEVINNGMNNLSLCFISPIRFGKNYLGCSKTSITTESCNNGEKFNMKMLLTFEDEPVNGEAFKPLDEYEGYFRLMTREGIPFGDILYVKVTIKN